MKSNNNILLIFLSGLVLATLSPQAMALESDSEQPIYIDSDRATYDESKGVSTYSGKVVSTQGSMKVTSDELVVHTKDGEVTQLVWTGNMVHLKQTPSEGKEDITGESLQAEYYPDSSRLVLKKKATVWQGDMTYKSELIEYDIRNNKVTAGETSSDRSRVHVEMKPKAKK